MEKCKHKVERVIKEEKARCLPLLTWTTQFERYYVCIKCGKIFK
jgi:hypothetical protein